jgi:hypothetical protein
MSNPPARPDLFYTEIVKSLHDYYPTEAGCLPLKAGDYIYVHQKDATGWWNGTCGDNTGIHPLIQDGFLQTGLNQLT